MPITFSCKCGKSFRVKDEYAGKRTKCTGCSTALVVPEPEPVFEVEEEKFEVVEDEPEPPSPPAPPKKPSSLQERFQASKTPTKPASAASFEKQLKADKSKIKKRRKKKRESEFSGVAVGPAVATGIAMMVGAVLWFVVGFYALDRIFFYPPVLFVLGIVSVGKGLMGHED